MKRCEVQIKKQEIEMIEKNFKRAYWPWEMSRKFRKRMQYAYVCMYVVMYTCTHIRVYNNATQLL